MRYLAGFYDLEEKNGQGVVNFLIPRDKVMFLPQECYLVDVSKVLFDVIVAVVVDHHEYTSGFIGEEYYLSTVMFKQL